jgi:hypothetical protein
MLLLKDSQVAMRDDDNNHHRAKLKTFQLSNIRLGLLTRLPESPDCDRKGQAGRTLTS